MKRLFAVAATVSMLALSATVLADPPPGRGWDKDRGGDWHHDNGNHNGHYKQAFRRGDRLPDRYWGRQYYVEDWRRYHLQEPRPGYRWVRSDDGQFLLIAAATGIIAEILAGN